MLKVFSFVEDRYVEVEDLKCVMGVDEQGECVVDRLGLIDGQWVSLGL